MGREERGDAARDGLQRALGADEGAGGEVAAEQREGPGRDLEVAGAGLAAEQALAGGDLRGRLAAEEGEEGAREGGAVDLGAGLDELVAELAEQADRVLDGGDALGVDGAAVLRRTWWRNCWCCIT